jgi:hypothetical protein
MPGRKGKAMPAELNTLQKITKESYNLTGPTEDVDGWKLIKWFPRVKFYMKGNDVIVGVRGTKTAEDVSVWPTIPLNTLGNTNIYKEVESQINEFKKEYPEKMYYAVGHSLGGALIDVLLRKGLIKEATSYNPAIQYNDINGGLPNRRIYYGSDPLYKLMGWWDKKSEYRPKDEFSQFLDKIYNITGITSSLSTSIASHALSNFRGGMMGKKPHFKVSEFMPKIGFRPGMDDRRRMELAHEFEQSECPVCLEKEQYPFTRRAVHIGSCGHWVHKKPCYNYLPGFPEYFATMSPTRVVDLGTKKCPLCRISGFGKPKRKGNGLCQSLFETAYEEPERPQMVTRRFSDDEAIHRTEEYPSIILPKKKSLKKKFLEYCDREHKKDMGEIINPAYFENIQNKRKGFGKKTYKGIEMEEQKVTEIRGSGNWARLTNELADGNIDLIDRTNLPGILNQIKQLSKQGIKKEAGVEPKKKLLFEEMQSYYNQKKQLPFFEQHYFLVGQPFQKSIAERLNRVETPLDVQQLLQHVRSIKTKNASEAKEREKEYERKKTSNGSQGLPNVNTNPLLLPGMDFNLGFGKPKCKKCGLPK